MIPKFLSVHDKQHWALVEAGVPIDTLDKETCAASPGSHALNERKKVPGDYLEVDMRRRKRLRRTALQIACGQTNVPAVRTLLRLGASREEPTHAIRDAATPPGMNNRIYDYTPALPQIMERELLGPTFPLPPG